MFVLKFIPKNQTNFLRINFETDPISYFKELGPQKLPTVKYFLSIFELAELNRF